MKAQAPKIDVYTRVTNSIIAAIADRPRKSSPDNLSEQFDEAKHKEHVSLPDVLSAFSRAAEPEDDANRGEDGGRDVPGALPPGPDAPRPGSERGKGRDR